METPTGIMKEDWSLAAHFLAEVYEQQPDVEAVSYTHLDVYKSQVKVTEAETDWE